jgi:hypothetical protein
MDAFAALIEPVRSTLPVIEQEIGDTWIHGAGTDPAKESTYRELLRWRKEKIIGGTPRAVFSSFHEKMLLVPEHTRGMDVKTHLQDWENYRPADFRAARSGQNFKTMEASWQEQRDYLNQALDSLPSGLKQEAAQRLADLAPRQPDLSGFEPVQDLAAPFDSGLFTAGFDPSSGCLIHLAAHGREWSSPQNPIGRFWYETFSDDDYQRFHRQYNVNERANWFWSIPDFTKPGIELAAPEHQRFFPRVVWAGRKQIGDDQDIWLLNLEMPTESWQAYGAPRRLTLEIAFSRHSPQVSFDLQWFEKTATRLPEASWFTFNPRVVDPHSWRMDKLGEWISPMEVIRDGNRHLHGLGEGIRAAGPRHTVQIRSLDAPLAAPGEPSLLNFHNRQPNLRKGWHFNLHNNVWGTNFPMWYEDDARFRFVMEFQRA